MTDAEREFREAFEVWCVTAQGYRSVPQRYDSGDYVGAETCILWTAWQAAWNARHPRADAEDRVVRLALETAVDWADRVSVGHDATPRIKVAMMLIADKARAALKALGGDADRVAVDVDKLATAIGGLWSKSNSIAGANCFTHKNVVEIINRHLTGAKP